MPRPRQAEILAQGPAFVFGPEQAATAQFRHDESDEILQAARQRGRHDIEAVRPTLQETLFQFLTRWFKLDAKAVALFPNVPADVVVTILAWSLYGGAIRWSRLEKRLAVAEAAKQVVDLLITK